MAADFIVFRKLAKLVRQIKIINGKKNAVEPKLLEHQKSTSIFLIKFIIIAVWPNRGWSKGFFLKESSKKHAIFRSFYSPN